MAKNMFFSQFQMKNSQSDQVHLVPENLNGFGCKWVENVVNNVNTSNKIVCRFGRYLNSAQLLSDLIDRPVLLPALY